MPWADEDGHYDEIDRGLGCKNDWNQCAMKGLNFEEPVIENAFL